MSFNKKIYLIGLIFSSILLIEACGDNEKEAPATAQKNYEDPEFVLSEAKSVLGDSVEFAYKGMYDKDSVTEVAAGLEVSDRDDWGIKFFLLKTEKNELQKVYETSLLDGSFSDSKIEKLNLTGYDYELLYYNSLNYFLGSGGGEIFSYILDFNEQKTYYAHLVVEKNGISLFLSDNIQIPAVKDYFVNTFKKDYPSLKVVQKDIDIID